MTVSNGLIGPAPTQPPAEAEETPPAYSGAALALRRVYEQDVYEPGDRLRGVDRAMEGAGHAATQVAKRTAPPKPTVAPSGTAATRGATKGATSGATKGATSGAAKGATSGAAKGASKGAAAGVRKGASKALKGAGRALKRVAAPVGIALDALSLGSAVSHGMKTGDWKPTAKTAGSVAGGIGGAAAGAALGTAVFPGVGTVIGGLLGGFLGAEAGEAAGGAVYSGLTGQGDAKSEAKAEAA